MSPTYPAPDPAFPFQPAIRQALHRGTWNPYWRTYPARSVQDGDLNRVRTHSTAAANASRSEPDYAAKSTVDVVHEGCRRVADRFLKVGLIEGDEGGDVDD